MHSTGSNISGPIEAKADQNQKVEATGLARYLTPLSVWGLSFGCAVGWGAFVMSGTTLLLKA